MSRTGSNVYFRPSTGKWEGRFIRGRRENGRLRYGYVSGATEAECLAKRNFAARAFEEEYRRIMAAGKRTFAAVAAQWIDSKAKTKKDSTICKYRNILNIHLNPKFGSRMLTEIRREEVASYIADLQAEENCGMSANTVRGIISVLRAVAAYGEMHQHLPSADFSRLPVEEAGERQPRLLTGREEDMLLDYILPDPRRDELGILLVLYTGLRLGELCALRWDDIDFEEGALTVRSTMKRIQIPYDPKKKTEVVLTAPKSRKSARTIPLHEDVLTLLEKRAGRSETFFLTGKADVYIEPRTMQNRFKATARAAGIAEANFHALRHTFATRCIENGVDAKALSEILGHASVKTTLDRYVHPSEEQKRRSMNSLPGFRSRIV